MCNSCVTGENNVPLRSIGLRFRRRRNLGMLLLCCYRSKPEHSSWCHHSVDLKEEEWMFNTS